MTHANMKPLKVYVQESFLYDGDPKPGFIKGTLFGLSSYPGEALSAQVLLENGSMWSALPLHALQTKSGWIKDDLRLEDLVYKNSPAPDIEVIDYDYLKGPVAAYFKKKDIWMHGQYVATVDWYKDNEEFHLVALENGRLAALPNHKLKFKNLEQKFEPYQKMHDTWKV